MRISCLVLILSAALACAAETAGDLLVTSFESAEGMARVRPLGAGAAVEHSTEHATDGKGSLRVVFRSAAAKTAGLRVNLRRADGTPADWSRFRTLRLDCHNPYHKDRPLRYRRSSARMDFSIHDAKGARWWHCCRLSPWVSEQTLAVPLVTTMDRMSALNDSPFDFGSVVDVVVYTKRPDEDLVLFFDNMRLAAKEGRAGEARPRRPARERVAPRTLGRDFVFAQHYHPNYPYEEKGLFRLGRGPVVLRLSQPGLHAPSVDLPGLLVQISELRERRIPFHVILFNFWYGRTETYEEATSRLREAVAACQAAGGELFQAAWLHELAAINYYRIVRERTSRLGKAEAYVELLGKFIRDIELPPGKLLAANQDWLVNYGLDYEAGVDAVLPETLFGLDNVELCMAQTRGMARSFGRWCGGDTARYSPSVPPTARYRRDGSTEPEKIDFAWWKTSDVHKAFIHHYYSGADILRGQSEWPARRPEDGQLFDRFLRLVEKSPRAGNVVSRIAIVRSKGDYWEGASLAGKGARLSRYRPAAWTKQEEMDFLYLNVFFPGFSDDGYTARRYWTGTPHGAIDVIYPSIPLEAMKGYDVLVFMGFHRMDSVRGDFLADLTRYVEAGGRVLLAADHLRMSDGKFAPAPAMRKLVGVELLEKTRPIAGPIRIVEQELARFPKGSYDLPPVLQEPVAHEVAASGAVAIAKDATGVPLVLGNRLGKGCALLLTTPTLSTLPPAGRSAFVRDLVNAAARSARQPVTISPACDHVESILGKSRDGRAVVFLMNHERAVWAGTLTVDLAQAGVSAAATPEVSLVVCRGYERDEPRTDALLKGEKLVIGGVRLPGAAEQFDPFRAASFAVLSIQSR